ncbi:ATP-binding protein [Massilia sp. R2A-15]|uniref:AAA family ATPase n=1 Tax=Massilia sp. R2A-15 TaxID=3064278 RepID=UPI002733A730|nr:ATP-binding protein [Massilia sp. R2A-15]WLI87725.1 ATP-binding protein [Massilia sp. R2A-15]
MPFSQDGITVFVGQNESGKTSILDALYFAFSKDCPTDDDFRIGAPLPIVKLRIAIDFLDIQSQLEDIQPLEQKAIEKYFAHENNIVEIDCVWNLDAKSKRLIAEVEMSDESFSKFRDGYVKSATTPSPSGGEMLTVLEAVHNHATVMAEDYKPMTPDDLANHIWGVLPSGVKFDEKTGRLPNIVDIDKSGNLIGEGRDAANNFLKIAGIDLPALMSKDKRSQETLLNKSNAHISEDFNNFWSQTIGQSGRLALRCELDRYDDSNEEKSGRSHLVFWISDGQNHLYPRQRSQGVSWFVSFYLQLKASEKIGVRRIFLLDEPGSNLHAKAQNDVLRLINKLAKNTCTVVYTTHSPQLLEYSRLYRVHAVQRDSDLDDSPSVVIDAHQLGTASSDTLSPILTAMGSNLSNQEVIKKTNNVLLEEMSGYYYLTAFWQLCKAEKEVHFIAATGVNKIEPLANMFVGWGLHFIVAIDDDSQGRDAYKSILRNMFADDVEIGKKRMLKFPDCQGIEDAFSANDLKSFVLCDDSTVIESKNSEFLKRSNRSKPVLAYQFLLRVQSGLVSFESLDAATRKKISDIVNAIASRLK